jgi:hypothetical protein
VGGVDVLEVVGVHDRQGQRGGGAGAADEFLPGEELDRPPVGDPGQRVGQGHLLQDAVLLLELGQRHLELAGAVGDPLFELLVELPQVLEELLVAPLEEERAGGGPEGLQQVFGPPRLQGRAGGPGCG